MKKLWKSARCAVANYQYYCEVIVGNGGYQPGVYTFNVDPKYGMWGKHSRLVQMSYWVWKEKEDCVFWIKNRSKPTPDKLTDDELKEFMWTKLKAKVYEP